MNSTNGPVKAEPARTFCPGCERRNVVNGACTVCDYRDLTEAETRELEAELRKIDRRVGGGWR